MTPFEITDWRHQSHTGTGWLGPLTQGLSRGVIWQTAVILNDCVARIMQACHSGLDSDGWVALMTYI